MLAIIILALQVTFAGGIGGSSSVITATNTFPVTSYGAKCDGTTNDLSAFNSATSAAQTAGGGYVTLPIGTCIINDTWKIGVSSGAYSRIGVVGASKDNTFIKFTGTNNRPAVFANHESYIQWSNFTIEESQAHGTSVGILVGADSGSGTQSTRLSLYDVKASGFEYGMILGESSPSVADASEFTCIRCEFNSNDVGFTTSGFNTLNIHLIDNDFQSNVRGVEFGGDGTYNSQTSTGALIEGGSTGNNSDSDFFFGNQFDTTTIEGVRAEPKGYFISGPSVNNLTLIGDVITSTSRTDHIVANFTNGGNLVIKSTNFTSPDTIQIGCGPIEIDNSILTEGSSGLPITELCSGNTISGFLKFTNNIRTSSARAFQNFSGWYVTYPSNHTIPLDTENQPSSFDKSGGLRFSNLRAIGSNPISGNNLQGTVVFATSGTATYTFVRTLTVNTVGATQTIVFSANAVTSADIGKPININGATNDAGGTCTGANSNTYGTITSITDTTHAVVTMGDKNSEPHGCVAYFDDSSSVTATIGQNEPDINWFPVGLACNKAETFSFDDATIATTGVTFKSSNASSVATCHFLIAR